MRLAVRAKTSMRDRHDCPHSNRTRMIGLFFEVEPLAGHADRYFELAAHLRPELDKNPGLLFIDRYSSLDRPGLVLSHSWWDTETSLIAWREHTGHRAIQRAGREQHFRDYRLRIGRLSEMADDHAARRVSRRVYVGYLDGEPPRRVDTERFKSVYRENKFLVLSASAPIDVGADQRVFDVIRDYTMYDRAEAPQDYPPVRRNHDQ